MLVLRGQMNKAKMMLDAYRLKNAVRRLELAKINSVRAHQGLPPLMTWYQKIYAITLGVLKQTVVQIFCPCALRRRNKMNVCCFKRDSFIGKLFTNGTYPNELLKSFFGFIGGTVLSFIMFIVMSISLEDNMKYVLCVAMGMGFVFSIGMAFSNGIRCIIFLMLPNFFTSKGRSFLLMFTMVLVMTHPVTNFTNNIVVMAESATCGQNMALNETKSLIELATSPVASIVGGIQGMLKAITTFANEIRTIFRSMKKAIEVVCAAISRLFKWLKNMTTKCNETMLGPYNKCKKAFEDAESDCRRIMSVMGFLCYIVKIVSFVCHVVRIGELLCLLVALVVNFVVDSIARPVNIAIDNIYDMFYFNVTLDYHFNLTMVQSRSYTDVKKAILDDIQSRVANIKLVVTIVESTMMIVFFLVFIRAMLYRWKYLTNDKFDNIYISDTLRYIDEKRDAKGMETIFPLSFFERGKYLTTFTIRLAKNESRKMLKGIITLTMSALHASCYMLCDYGLYWILNLIRDHFEVKTNPAVPAHLKLHVQGRGSMADMYRSMVNLLDPVTADQLQIDTTPCLPNPGVPNIRMYKFIGYLFLLCLFMCLLESYALRIRHFVAGCYYPKRNQARAVWLYNKILKTRSRFLTLARRQLRRKYKKDENAKKVSIRSRIALQCPCLGKVLAFFGYKTKICLSCATEGRSTDYVNFQHCESPNCNAVYCFRCFAELNNMCTVCMNPIEYGDESDMSEEKDSSDDEFHEFVIRERAKERRRKMEDIRQKNRASNIILTFKGLAGIDADATNADIMEMDRSAPIIISSSSDSSDLDLSYQNMKVPVWGNQIAQTKESYNKIGFNHNVNKVNQHIFSSSDSDSD